MRTQGLAAHAQGASFPKMAQVRIVVAKDSTGVLTWERGMNLLSIYEMNTAEQITLHLALGVEAVIGKLLS